MRDLLKIYFKPWELFFPHVKAITRECSNSFLNIWIQPKNVKQTQNEVFLMTFLRKAANAVKKNNSTHFTALLTKIHRWLHHIFYKNLLHQFSWQNYAINAVNAVKKYSQDFTAFLRKNSPQNSPHFLQKTPHLFSNVYWIWFNFTRKSIEVSDSSRSGIRSWRNAGGERFDPVYRSFFFARIPRTQWK